MTQEALKLALEALQFAYNHCDSDWVQDEKINPAITAIKEALAQPEQTNIKRHEANVQKFLGAPQPEQEPVAWMDADGNVSDNNDHKCFPIPLYTIPPQRTERPVDCERCNRLEEQAYDLVGKLRVAKIKLSMQPQRTFVGLAAEDRLTAKYMQDAPDGIEAVIDYIEAKLKELNDHSI